MFIKNGIVYASTPQKELRLTAAKVLPYGMLLLTFASGEKRLFDVTTLEGSAFAPLQTEEARRTAAVTHGYLTWLDGEIDCAPEYLYAHSEAYNEADLVG